MNIYVASSWRNERQPEVVKALRDAGHTVYDFRNPKPGDNGFSWRQIREDAPPWSAEQTREVLAHSIAEHGFKLDIDAMRRADAVVMVQPCGRSAALELGWCAGVGKRSIVLLADGCEPELMFKVADHMCLSVEEVIEKLSDKDIVHAWHYLYEGTGVSECRRCKMQRRPSDPGVHQYRREHAIVWWDAAVEPVCVRP